jgi:hypothetical protein
VNAALLNIDRVALWALYISTAFAAPMAVAVIVQPLQLIAHERVLRRLRHRYGPVIDRALGGDPSTCSCAALRGIGSNSHGC